MGRGSAEKKNAPTTPQPLKQRKLFVQNYSLLSVRASCVFVCLLHRNVNVDTSDPYVLVSGDVESCKQQVCLVTR